MDKDLKYIQVKNNSTLKESFKLDLEEILSLDSNCFLEESRAIIQIIRKYVSDFDNKYKVAGATNINICNQNYVFPVLTTNHKDTLFPYLLVCNNSIILDYHETKFKKVQINSD